MTGYIYRGDQRLIVARPLEEMPIFLRAGAIVPLQAHQAQGNQLGCSAEMTVVVAPGASGDFRLYEDDGVSLSFQQGAYAQTPLTLDWTEKSAVFTIGQAQGDVSLLPERRTWTVAFRGWHRGCTFTVDGKPAAAQYDAWTNTYTVVLPPMQPDTAAAIAVTNGAGLLHDNSDFRERVIDCLTCAQMQQDAKALLLKWVDDAVAQPRERWLPLNTRPDLYPNLGAHLYELMTQLP